MIIIKAHIFFHPCVIYYFNLCVAFTCVHQEGKEKNGDFVNGAQYMSRPCLYRVKKGRITTTTQHHQRMQQRMNRLSKNSNYIMTPSNQIIWVKLLTNNNVWRILRIFFLSCIICGSTDFTQCSFFSILWRVRKRQNMKKERVIRFCFWNLKKMKVRKPWREKGERLPFKITFNLLHPHMCDAQSNFFKGATIVHNGTIISMVNNNRAYVTLVHFYHLYFLSNNGQKNEHTHIMMMFQCCYSRWVIPRYYFF